MALQSFLEEGIRRSLEITLNSFLAGQIRRAIFGGISAAVVLFFVANRRRLDGRR
jgi:hypothetical protein